MAGHDQFPTYSYTMERPPSLPCPPADQPVFPTDFRQFRGMTSPEHMMSPQRFQENNLRNMNIANNSPGYFQHFNDFTLPVNNYMFNNQTVAMQSGALYNTVSQGHSSGGNPYSAVHNNGFQNNIHNSKLLDPSREDNNTEILIKEENCNYDNFLKEDDILNKTSEEEDKHKHETNYKPSQSEPKENNVENANADNAKENVDETGINTTESNRVSVEPEGEIKIKQEFEEIEDDAQESDDNVSGNDTDSTIIDESEKSKITDDLDSDQQEPKKKKRKKTNKKSPITKVKVKLTTPAKKQEFKCDECGKVVQTARALEKHNNLHTGIYSCKECGKICNSANSLVNHMKIHKGFVGSDVCNVCDKVFFDKSSLNKHTLSVHMGIKNFQCDYCELSFYAKKTYEEHVRVHTGERPFKCDICPKSYKRIADLNHHIRLHKGEVSHTCELCGEGYRRSSELRRHMQKHGDVTTPIKSEKPKVCEWCSIKFPTAKSLQEHIRTHMEGIDGSTPANSEKHTLVNSIVSSLGSSGLSQSFGSVSQTESSFQREISPKELFARHMMMTKQYSNSASVGFPYYRASSDIGTIHKPAAETQESQAATSGSVSQASNSLNVVSQKTLEKAPNKSVEKLVSTDKINGNKNTAGATDTVKNKVVHDDDVVNIKQEQVSDAEEDMDYNITVNSDVDNDYGSDTEIEDTFYDDLTGEDSDYKPVKTSPRGKKKAMKLPVVKPKKGRKTVGKKRKLDDNDNDDKDSDKPAKAKKGKRVDKSDEPSTFICEECGKFFSRRESFTKHMNLHTGIYTCGLCSKSFASQLSLDTHMDNHEGRKEKTATCKVCDKTFYDMSSLNKHTKNVHMQYRPYACTDCDRKFSEKKSLVEHIRVHTGEMPFKCEICNQAFKRHSELNFHTKKHTGETKISCEECGEGFRRPSELKHHMMVKHEGNRPYQCSYCGRGFMSNPILQEHILTHSSEKNFECDKCGKGFYSKSKLAKHNRIKSDCRRAPQKVNGYYTCRYCLLQFLELPNLNTHMYNVHEVEGVVKKYSCQVCYKEFRRRQALKRHLKIHAQIRDYKCGACGAAFIQRHHLTQHERTHTGEKPFKCDKCFKSFAQSATLYSHMKHH